MNEDQIVAQSPLLSICIPTYNRAEWLRLSLEALLPQITKTNGRVELVVSDNCSPDHTPEVVKKSMEGGNFRYHRNQANIGGNPNFFLLVNDLAYGDYVWVLGDDDLVRENAVTKILDVLEAYHNLDYVNINYKIWSPSGPQDVCSLSEDFDWNSSLGNPNLESGYVERLAHLVDGDRNCFTPIYGSIFRRHIAVEAFKGSLCGKPFTTLDSVFSHSVYIADNLLNRPAYYIGYPCSLVSYSVSWPEYMPITVLKLFPELYDRFERGGATPAQLRPHRLSMLRIGESYLYSMLFQADVPLKGDFSLKEWTWTHRFYRETWIILYRVLKRRIVSNLWKLLPSRVQSFMKLSKQWVRKAVSQHSLG